MAEIKAEGYVDLRTYIQDTWKYIELRKTDGTPVLRISTSDPRVVWTHAAGAQTLELTATLTGSDADITLPQAFGQSAIYKVASGGTPFSVEPFTEYSMESANDKLTVKHTIQVPKVV